jgi:hypothetical protein
VSSSLLATLLAIPVIFESAICHAEAALSYNVTGINFERELVIHNLLAALTNQIDVYLRVCLISVFHFVKLQHLNDSVLGKFVQDGVDCRQAQTFYLPSCFMINKVCTWMKKIFID